MTDELQPVVDESKILERSFQDVVQGAEALGAAAGGLGTFGIGVAKLMEAFGGREGDSTPPPSDPASAPDPVEDAP